MKLNKKKPYYEKSSVKLYRHCTAAMANLHLV